MCTVIWCRFHTCWFAYMCGTYMYHRCWFVTVESGADSTHVSLITHMFETTHVGLHPHHTCWFAYTQIPHMLLCIHTCLVHTRMSAYTHVWCMNTWAALGSGVCSPSSGVRLRIRCGWAVLLKRFRVCGPSFVVGGLAGRGSVAAP